MKKPMLWMAAALAPVLLASPILAQDSKAPVAEKSAEAKSPTLSFYYFDG